MVANRIVHGVLVLAAVFAVASCSSASKTAAPTTAPPTSLTNTKQCDIAINSTAAVTQSDIDACEAVAHGQLHKTDCGNGKKWTEVTLEGSDVGMIAGRPPSDLQTKLTTQALGLLCDDPPPSTVSVDIDPCQALISAAAPISDEDFHNCSDWHQNNFDSGSYSCPNGYTSAYGTVQTITDNGKEWAFMVKWPPTLIPTGDAQSIAALNRLCQAPS